MGGRVRVKVWGCRGTLASPGPETNRYGGNTSCVEVRLSDGTLIVLDAGTGIRQLGLSLVPERDKISHVFLSHLHLDHIEGLGLYSMLWRPDADVDVYVSGPRSGRQSLETRIERYMSPPLFPVELSDAPSKPILQDLPAGEFRLGSAMIRAEKISHPGATYGYRITENGRSFAYMPDHEPALGVDLENTKPEKVSGYAIAQGADVLIHDSQYTTEEYATRVGWGHSLVDDLVTYAHLVDAKQVVMFHHDPMHDDEMLDGHRGRARERWSGNGDAPILAYEGMEFEL